MNNLEAVKKIRALREREEIANLGSIQKLLDQDRDKLKELENYQAQYYQDFGDGRQGLSDTQTLRVQKDFLLNVDMAIDQQKKQIEQRSKLFEQQRLIWLGAKQELQAIEKYAEKQALNQAYENSRNEQKVLDDLVQVSRQCTQLLDQEDPRFFM